MVPDINSPEDLETWLSDKPVDWVRVVGTRNALRIFPLSFRLLELPVQMLDVELKQNLILQTFRAIFISWAACKYPAYKLKRSAASAAAANTAALRAAANAGNVVFLSAAASVANAAYAIAAETTAAATAAVSVNAANAGFAADATATAIWQAMNEDCVWLEAKPGRRDLIDQPLWFSDVRGDKRFNANFPIWLREPFDAFIKAHWTKSEVRKLISDWYRAILPNGIGVAPHSPFGEKATVAIAAQPDTFWTVSEGRNIEQILIDIWHISMGETSQFNEERSVPELIVDFLENRRRYASIDEIRDYFGKFDPAPADTTIRGRLSDLATSGKIIRKEQGLYIHPKWHVLEENNKEALAKDVSEAVENLEPQFPAAFRFGWRANKIEAAPPADVSSDPESAQIYLDEARRKAQMLAERLLRSNAERRVVDSVNGLFDVLTENIKDLRPQLVRSRARSVEADAQAYSKPQDEERELFPDAVAALIDLSETVKDLQGCYPQLRNLEAEITALDLDPSRVNEVKDKLDEIVEAASEQEQVLDQSAIYALHTMEALAGESASPDVKQKRVAEYALVVRNFISPVARFALDNVFAREAKRLSSEIYMKARPKIVDGVVDGVGSMARPATILLIAGLVGMIGGPTAGIATAAVGFGKVDRLLKLAEKLLKTKFETQNSVDRPQSDWELSDSEELFESKDIVDN
ncbi:hypothetical protein [Roseibium sp.]|uniref:hypothetical protein n=1 Tax=Roseibium sp. TaxID=1936156 RepID=UPI003A96DDB7